LDMMCLGQAEQNDIWVLFVACGGYSCALQFSIMIIDLMSMHVAYTLSEI
jgi:hypothetical protein